MANKTTCLPTVGKQMVQIKIQKKEDSKPSEEEKKIKEAAVTSDAISKEYKLNVNASTVQILNLTKESAEIVKSKQILSNKSCFNNQTSKKLGSWIPRNIS